MGGLGVPMAFVRTTLRERTLLHLAAFTGYDESNEVPPALTQHGMARQLVVRRAQVAQVLIELKEKALARERVCHVRGSARRMKAFVLTAEGRRLADQLRRSVLERTLAFTDAQSVTTEWTVKALLEQYPDDLDLTTLLRIAGDGRGIDHGRIVETGLRTAPPDHAADREGGGAPESRALVADGTPEPDRQWPVQDAGGPAFSPSPAPGAAAPASDGQTPVPPTQLLGGVRALAVISLALGIVVLGIAFAVLFLLGPLGFILGLALMVVATLLLLSFYLGLRQARIEVLGRWERYTILVPALFMTYVTCFFASFALGASWDANALGSYIGVQVPLAFVLAAAFLIPASVRGQIGIVLGAFLLALATTGLVGGAAFSGSSGSSIHPVMWLATGAMAGAIGNEIARPERRDLGLWVSSGIGLYLITGSISLLRNATAKGAGDPGTVGLLALWLVLGLFVLGVRAAPRERLGVLAAGLGSTALLCIGTAFFLFGVWFLRIGRFEGGIDMLVGLPVAYYALAQLRSHKRSDLRILGAMMGYAVVVEAASLGRLLSFF